jgi:hypothetical protein
MMVRLPRCPASLLGLHGLQDGGAGCMPEDNLLRLHEAWCDGLPMVIVAIFRLIFVWSISIQLCRIY